jgi:hypothetical protein
MIFILLHYCSTVLYKTYLATANFLMMFQVFWSGEGLLTNVTLIWLLPFMSVLIYIQILWLGEAVLKYHSHMASTGNEFFYAPALNKRISFYKYDIHMVSLLCEFSYVLPDFFVGRIFSYKYHLNMASLQCESFYVFSGSLIRRNFSYIYHINMVSLQCEFSYVVSVHMIAEILLTHVTHMPLLSVVSLLMFHQVALVPEPQLTTLVHMFPFLIVPVHVSYRVRRPRVRFPAARFVTRVNTGCELLLQESNKILCIRGNGIHVR